MRTRVPSSGSLRMIRPYCAPAVTGLVVQEQEVGAHKHGEDSQIGDALQHRDGPEGGHAKDLPIPQRAQGHVGAAGLQAAQRLVAGDDLAGAVDNGLHAQGRDEGGGTFRKAMTQPLMAPISPMTTMTMNRATIQWMLGNQGSIRAA